VDIATLQAQQTLLVRQRFTMMINRYEVRLTDASGHAGPLVGFAEQKRMTLKEQVTLFTDDSKRAVLARFKARSVMDLRATYDVTDGNGAPIGLFRKAFAASLLRSTWHVEQPNWGTATGQERSLLIALMRRFADLSFWPYHFDFVSADGRTAFSVEKRWGIRDTYVVTVHDPRLDRRLVIAMAVALDALQSR
jgi:uncharacterized protein YxjI